VFYYREIGKGKIMNEYDYLLKQLDLLIGFLDVSDEAIYVQIKNHDQFGLGFTIEQLYDNKYENFKNHICTSALLLGFAHIEDFISKCLEKFLIANPEKNQSKVTLQIIKERGDSLVKYLAEEQSKQLKFSEKIKFIEKHFANIDKQILTDIKLVNDIRNCIMHNNGIADNRVSPLYKIGEKITLSAFDANSFGIKARKFAEELWVQINNKKN
jgi:hypothetical protein